MRPCKRTSPACGGGGSPDEPDDGKYRRSVFIGALTLGFGLGVALFFSTGAPLPCKVCYPAAWLSLVLFALRDQGVRAGSRRPAALGGGRCRRSSARLSAPNVPLRAGARRLHPLFPAVGRILPQTASPPRQSSVPACSCSSSPASSPAWRRPSNGRVSHSTAR